MNMEIIGGLHLTSCEQSAGASFEDNIGQDKDIKASSPCPWNNVSQEKNPTSESVIESDTL